ncbi:Rho guanyl-nucleotide exchange factor [Mycena sanguinolenta]|uniref:Rho guanyl-nucleotide exchange factor n=1 Tax=Mycena sanguinolenta TaxID=230812 RepID=A0A8H6Z4S1_9AGAR|nr:Rho guanyl-nucleotide exchange factor [Mycena sanguinolenta]
MAPSVAITLSEGFFKPNQVNCDGRIVYGTDDGVYLQEMKKDPVKVLAAKDVSQVDVLEDSQLLILRSERQVLTFPLDALDSTDPTAGLSRAMAISKKAFFKVGFCLGRVLVTTVKTSTFSTTIKVLEPAQATERPPGESTTLKVFKEFYLASGSEVTSIHYLKMRLCVACPSGFEIIDLENLETQRLLDPSDDALSFLVEKPPRSFLPWQHRAELPHPVAIYRINSEFLLCYDKFAFFVNRLGKRTRNEIMITWEGQPTAFALCLPYVLAFSPSFVEVRIIESGVVRQKIPGSNIRLLSFANMPPSVDASGGGNLADEGQHLDQLQQGSDEILMVSEDRILSLRLAENSQD